jgi:hypothetical protein
MSIPQSITVSKRRPRTRQLGRWLEAAALAIIIALAIFLRYYLIGQVPPGLNSDEAVGAIGAVETLRSGPQLYYAGQGGGGSLGFYIAAVGFALFGPSVASLRGTAAFAGMVSVVATYFATREMFRPSVGMSRARSLALLSTLGLAISLWHVQSSRIAFAAIGVPLLQVPGNYFLWRGLNTGRRIHFVVSGVLLASLMYIYLSGSFAPFVYLVFFLLQWLILALGPKLKSQISNLKSPISMQPPLLKQHLTNLVLCAGVAFALFLPMLYFYLTAPELATERAQQALFTNPLIHKGDMWGTLWRSLWGNLTAFGLSLSLLSARPPANLIMPPPVALLFLIGLAISLWRVRQPPYLFTLVSWAVMLLPSILSPDTIPHRLRAVGAAPAAFTLVAVGVMGMVELVHRAEGWGLQRLRPKSASRSVGSGQTAVRLALTGVVLSALGIVVVRPVYRDFYYYMVEWPKTNDAQADYHVYAVDLAAEMSQETNPRAVFLLPRDTAAGDVNPNYTVMFLYTGQADYAWVVDDENKLEATLNAAVQGNDVVHVVRWKTSKHTGADPKEAIRYYLEKHGGLVESRSFEYYDIETYRLDQAGPDLRDAPLSPAGIDFGGQITLSGYAFGGASGPGEDQARGVPAGDLAWVRLRLRLTVSSAENLKASVVVIDSAGHPAGQIDKLLLNNVFHKGSAEWQPGTEVDAYFLVPIAPATPAGDYHLAVAVYGADSLTRLPVSDGDANGIVRLGTIAVRPDRSPPGVDALGLSVALNQHVTDELTLLGLTTAAGETLRPGERASLALVWRAERAPSDDYRVGLWAVRGDEGRPLTDWLPLAGIDYASSRWGAGQVVRGWLDGRVPRDLESGEYALGVRVLDSAGRPVGEAPLGKLQVQGWERRFDVPPMQVALGADFGDQVELLGYDLSASDSGSGTLDIVLYWRALSVMDVSYTTFVHRLDEKGMVVGQVDHAPGDGGFPTTGWLPGEVIADRFVLPWPEGRASAEAQLEVGVYSPATGKRLLVIGGGPHQDRVLLPTVGEE